MQRFAIFENFDLLMSALPQADTPENLISDVLLILLKMGFSRARYYYRAKDVYRNEYLMVLAATEPNESTRYLLGYQAPFAESTLASQNQTDRPVIGNVSNYEGIQPPRWVTDLELLNKSWLEIPLLAGGVLQGILAVDWPGPPELLEDHDLQLLSTLVFQVGGLLPTLQHHNIQPSFSEESQASTQKMVSNSASELASLLDCACTAVFEFNWTTKLLTKVHEVIRHTTPPTAHSPSPPEVYQLNQYLTGTAWQDPTYRYIVDFSALTSASSIHVAPASYTYHQRILGRIRSVMYAVVGNVEPRFMFRFINRASDPDIPFLHEFQQLNTYVANLSLAVDSRIAEDRLRILQAIATSALSNVAPLRDIVQQVHRGLLYESVEDFAIYCHRKDSTRFSYTQTYGDRLGNWGNSSSTLWQDDIIYLKALTSPGPTALDLRRYTSQLTPNQTKVSRSLQDRGFRYFLAFPLELENVQGSVFIPVADSTLIQSNESPNTSSTSPIFRMLQAYSSVAITAVHADLSRETTQGALNALGYIGHELGSPVAVLGDAASQATVTSKRLIRKTSAIPLAEKDRLLTELDTIESKIRLRRREISELLALTPVIAQQRKDELTVHFRPTDLFTLLTEAMDRVMAEIAAAEDDPPRRPIHIQISDSCHRLGTVNCDPTLIRLVLINLLRNAVKYSHSRFPNQPITVRVFGQPQSRLSIIQVQNWGLGIPEDRLELIFQPFVRGGVTDRKRAVRGMGLGLYLSRKIMLAHKGDIFCKSSRPTLDDRSRTEIYEGFETTFELRLPHILPEGSYNSRVEE